MLATVHNTVFVSTIFTARTFSSFNKADPKLIVQLL